VHDCLKAADKLKAEKGVSAEVIDLAQPRAARYRHVLRSVQKTGRCVVASQAIHIGSYTGEIASTISGRDFRLPRRAGQTRRRQERHRAAIAHSRGGVPCRTSTICVNAANEIL
jgi:transketolase C-terminal domain/subunit